MSLTEPSTSILNLVTDSDWIHLHTTLDSSLQNVALANVLEQLKLAGACSALVESEYLDRDYSEEFSAFYGKLFRRFRRQTQRLHFFKTDLSQHASGGVVELVAHMQAANGSGDYLGFAVIRPVRDAPLGRVVLAAPKSPSGIDVRVQVRTDYWTHPLGANLSIRGMPFTQQDSRISACAQASIWMSGRHFHTRHRGPWCSTVAITEAASQPTDMTLATALPAGSSGLNINNMLRALRSMDRHPYAFAAELTPNGLIWPGALDPAAILARYVESGIPVIVGLAPWQSGQREWHAAVVLGDSFEPQDPPVLSRSRASIAELSPYFLVHDDQRGPNLLMGARPGMPHAETPYNVRDHVGYIIVPLPDKVFLPGEAAERTAWDYLQFHAREWPALKAEHSALIAGSVALGDAVIAATASNQVIARTYLTFGWKYKKRLLESNIAPVIKDRVALHDLPRLVWVTELGRLDDMNKLDAEDRLIFGHCVVDATSTGPFQPPLIFHVPGFLTIIDQLNPTFFSETLTNLVPIDNDQLYRSRVRSTS